MATSIKKVIVDPLSENNPVTIQILGICSSLAVTTQVDKAFVMSVGLTVVTAFSNASSSCGHQVEIAGWPLRHPRLATSQAM